MLIVPIRTQTLRRKTQWGTLLPALAAGLAAAGLAFLLVRSRLPVSAAVPTNVSVVTAARDIPARTKLTAALLQMQSISRDDVPEGAAQRVTAFVGKVSVQPIGAGAVVVQSAVAAPSAALGMAFTLPPSLRAVTVATDPADGIDLFVRPEDHVDILATDEPGSGPAEARTVLQNVLLLAVGGQTSPDPPAVSLTSSGAAHVTVAVTPVQAQALVLAAARGHLHLALRAIGDGSDMVLPALPAPVIPAYHREHHSSVAHLTHTLPPVKVDPLPPLSLVPIALPPEHMTMTVIKGSFSQTVSVAP